MATGNDLNNVLIGNNAGNILMGQGGNDFMVGKSGGDFYFVDSDKDACIEDPDGGKDKVIASVSYKLQDDIENLELSENSSAKNGAGNSLINRIRGNRENNNLTGNEGADYLTGRRGHDTFIYKRTRDSRAWAPDRIMDFHADNLEKIDISRITSWSPNPNDRTFRFIGEQQFSLNRGEVRVVPIPASGGLTVALVNNDKDRDAEMVIHIRFDNASTSIITAANFLL